MGHMHLDGSMTANPPSRWKVYATACCCQSGMLLVNPLISGKAKSIRTNLPSLKVTTKKTVCSPISLAWLVCTGATKGLANESK